MEFGDQVRPSAVPDEFAERLRRVCEAQELQRDYCVQVRHAAIASWAGLAVAVLGVWIFLSLLADAVSLLPTLGGGLPLPAKPSAGATRTQPPTLIEANSRWFEQNGGRLSR
jgi:hypothetical protein